MNAVPKLMNMEDVSGADAKSLEAGRGLTRVDCYFWKASGADGSSYTALNPGKEPGSFAVAGACASRQGLGSHVASKLALDYFVQGVVEYFSPREADPLLTPEGESADAVEPDAPKERCISALEHAFRVANTSVYGFGHKLAAGGRLAASLAGLVVVDDIIGAGRVGASGAYLCRAGEIFPFFEVRPYPPEESELLGTQSLVAVQLASVAAREQDVIFLSSSPLTPSQERELVGVIGDLDLTDTESLALRAPHSHRNPCAQIIHALFGNAPALDFAMLVLIGPQVIYLNRTL